MQMPTAPGGVRTLFPIIPILFFLLLAAGSADALTPVSGNTDEDYEDPVRQERILLQPMVFKEAKDVSLTGDKFRVVPTASISVGAEDNFYRTSNNERDVLETLVQPGIQMEYDTGRTRFSLGYTLNAHFYEDLDDPPPGEKDADDDDYLGHTLNFIGQTIPTSKITLTLEDIFHRTQERSKADRLANDIRRELFYINRLTPMIYYQMTRRISLDLRYRNTITEYDDETDEDSIEHAGIVGLNYEFRPTWWLSLGYEYSDRNYEVDVSDYTQDHISLSLRKRSKYNLYEASVGYNDRQFDFREDEDTVTWLLAFTRQLGYETYTRIALEQNFNQSGIAENFFRATQASLSFGKIFRGGRIPVTLNTFYREGDYRQDSILLPNGQVEDREDQRYGLQASIGYNLFRWLTLLLTAGYENNESNLERFEYDNAYITLGVNTAFSPRSRE